MCFDTNENPLVSVRSTSRVNWFEIANGFDQISAAFYCSEAVLYSKQTKGSPHFIHMITKLLAFI